MELQVKKTEDGVTFNLKGLNEKDAARKIHDLTSAVFRLKHIVQMLDQGRPIEDFTTDIKASFQDAVQLVDTELNLLKTIYAK